MVAQRVLVLEVTLVLAALHLVEGRLRDVDVAVLDEGRHLPVEEGEQQGADVGAVDVRVRHDDDAVVAELIERELVLADARAHRRDERGDLLRGEHLVEARLLDVQDLALEGQDRLELAVAALLGRPTGGVSLDEVELAQLRVPLLAVGELARQPDSVENALAPRELARLAGRLARARSLHHLRADHLRVGGLLEQELRELLGDDLLDDGLDLG